MKCPGQDSRYWKPGAVFETKCPNCGEEVEFFKDDTARRCKKCGHRFLNPKLDFGCAAYCKYAEQCIGNLPPELIAQKEDLFKDRVAIEVKRHLKRDFKRIGHAMRVAGYAEQLGREECGNLAVIIASAYLSGVDDNGAGHDGTVHGPADQKKTAVARDLLTRLGAKDELIREVCAIIAQLHRPEPEGGVNFQCVHDAERIASLEEENKKKSPDPERMDRLIEASLLTKSGPPLAEKVLRSPGSERGA